MANRYLLRQLRRIYSNEKKQLKVLDAGAGDGETSRLLKEFDHRVFATVYDPEDFKQERISCQRVDLNQAYPFEDESFDAVNFVELIEHLESHAFQIRQWKRILRPNGFAIVTTPNIHNIKSRVWLMLSTFMKAYRRPVRYDAPPEEGQNMYMLHFPLFHYLCYRYGFRVESIHASRIKWNTWLFAVPLYPIVWTYSWYALIWKEKDAWQREINREVFRWLMSRALMMGENMLVKIRRDDSLPLSKAA